MLKITFRHIYLRAQCLGEAVVQEFVEIHVCVVNTGGWQPRTLLFNSFLFIEPAVTVKF